MESALAATRIASSQYPTLVALWDLEKTSTESQPPEAEFYVPEALAEAYSESVIGTDQRKLVANKDFAPGGKYRSIVKIFGRMEGQKDDAPFMMATGWLIRDDLVVTAGHVACDWDHRLGLLKEIKCYIGYHGRDKVKDPNVQFRHGVTVASPAEWLKGPNSAYDVSFIKLERPFTGIQPFRFVNTPAKGKLTLGVVGYPGDLKRGGKIGGEYMHEMYLPVSFNLAANKKKMLAYKIDTFGGNSGSPVLNKAGMEAIGVHVLGGTINSASVIGPLGNNFKNFIASFTRKPATASEASHGQGLKTKNFRIVSVRAIDAPAVSFGKPVNGNLTDGARLTKDIKEGRNDEATSGDNVEAKDEAEAALGAEANQGESGDAESGDQESFMDFIKAGVSSLGMLGGPIPIIASGALAVAPSIIKALQGKKKKESASDESGQEPFESAGNNEFDNEASGSNAGGEGNVMLEADLEATGSDPNIVKNGNVAPGPVPSKVSAFPPEFAGKPARAILAQAALQSIIKLPPSVLDQYGIFPTMSSTVKKYQKYSRKVNPILSKVVQPTAFDILLEEVQKSRAKWQPRPPPQGSKPKAGFEGFLEAFVAEGSLEESELSTEGIEGIVREALSESASGLSAESFESLGGLAPMESEAAETEGLESIAPSAALSGLAEGAVLAEAALEAMMTLPSEVMQTEGMIDAIKDVIKIVTPTVVKYGPKVWSRISGAVAVADTVNTAIGIVKKDPKKESSPGTGADAEGYPSGDPSEATIDKPSAATNADKHAKVTDDNELPIANGVNGTVEDNKLREEGGGEVNDETGTNADEAGGGVSLDTAVGLPNPDSSTPAQKPVYTDPNVERFTAWLTSNAQLATGMGGALPQRGIKVPPAIIEGY